MAPFNKEFQDIPFDMDAEQAQPASARSAPAGEHCEPGSAMGLTLPTHDNNTDSFIMWTHGVDTLHCTVKCDLGQETLINFNSLQQAARNKSMMATAVYLTGKHCFEVCPFGPGRYSHMIKNGSYVFKIKGAGNIDDVSIEISSARLQP